MTRCPHADGPAQARSRAARLGRVTRGSTRRPSTRVDRGTTAGDEVSVIDPRGNLLGRGFYSPGSAIPVRLLVRDAKTQIDAALLPETVRARRCAARVARAARATTPPAYRLVHAEGDGLPGLVVDRYGDVLAVQFGTVRHEARARRSSSRRSRRFSRRAPSSTERADQSAKMRGLRAGLRASCGARSITRPRVRRARPALPHPARARPEDGLLLRSALAPGARRAARARASASSTPTPSWALSPSRRRAAGRARSSRSTRARVGPRGRRGVRGARTASGDRVKFVKEDARRALAEAQRLLRPGRRRSAAAGADARGARAGAPRVHQARRERVPRGATGGPAGPLLVLGRGGSHGADAGARDGRHARRRAGHGARAMVSRARITRCRRPSARVCT